MKVYLFNPLVITTINSFEKWLSKRADEGWILKSTKTCIFCFERKDPIHLSYIIFPQYVRGFKPEIGRAMSDLMREHAMTIIPTKYFAMKIFSCNRNASDDLKAFRMQRNQYLLKQRIPYMAFYFLMLALMIIPLLFETGTQTWFYTTALLITATLFVVETATCVGLFISLKNK